MSADKMSPEDRAAFEKWRDTCHRSANPAIDADFEALAVTRPFSRGVADHPLLKRLMPELGVIRVEYPSDDELAKWLTYEQSNMPRRGRQPWVARGYGPEELQGRTEARFATDDRVQGFEQARNLATYNAPGTVDVVLVTSVLSDRGNAWPAWPTIPNTAVTVEDSAEALSPEANDDELALPSWLDDVDFPENQDLDDGLDEPPAVEPEREPHFAYSVKRLARQLLRVWPTHCIPCAAWKQKSSGSHFACLIGRGQRVLVLPMCGTCYLEFQDAGSLRSITNDDYIHQVGYPIDNDL